MTSHSPASSPELPHRLPRLHRLKTDPEVYQAVLSGRKTFEIRLNDRDFRVGDELLLMETTATGEAIRAGAPLQFTGNELRKRVSHVLSGYGLMPDWVCLSFEAGSAAAAQAAKQVPGDWQPSAIAPQGLLDWLNRRRNESKSVCLIEPDDSVAQAWLDEFDRLLDERKPDSYSRNRINFTMTINWENDSPRQTITVFRSVIKAVNARFEGVCYLAPAAPTGEQA